MEGDFLSAAFVADVAVGTKVIIGLTALSATEPVRTLAAYAMGWDLRSINRRETGLRQLSFSRVPPGRNNPGGDRDGTGETRSMIEKLMGSLDTDELDQAK